MAHFISSLLVVVVVQAAARHASKHDDKEAELNVKRISPSLEPKSDKRFFGKDYPYDRRAVVDKYYVFHHPYPAVQDGGDYDRDFVKDENSDNGQWDAQMHYDTLRHNIQKEKKKLQELKEKMEKEHKEWMDAMDKEKDAAKDSQAAGDAVTDAKDASEAARKKVNDLEGSSDASAPGGAIGDAAKKVEDEMSDLEKCKEALAKAKERLKKLLEEQEEAAKKAQEEKERQEKEDKELADKMKKEEDEEEKARALRVASAENATDTQNRSAGNDGWDEEAWQKRLEQAKKDHVEAIRKYEKELLEVKRTEDQLARAAENLRKFRRPPYVDDDGGVYNVPKSSAFLPSTFIAFFCVSLAAYVS